MGHIWYAILGLCGFIMCEEVINSLPCLTFCDIVSR